MSTSEEKNFLLHGFPTDYKNPRGIPPAKFIENVEEYIKNSNQPIENIIKSLQEILQKYTLMELNSIRQRNALKKKIPEIEKTLQAVHFLKEKMNSDEEINSHYQLCDNIFAHAKLEKTDKVGLWLGANVMVEYSFDEAIELLNKNLAIAKKNLENVNEDLAYLKDQITTTEVSVSRIYNYGVLQKNKK